MAQAVRNVPLKFLPPVNTLHAPLSMPSLLLPLLNAAIVERVALVERDRSNEDQ